MDENGKRIPLDPSAPVYRVDQYDPQAGVYAVTRATGHMVSHFKTCPRASEFSGSKRKEHDARVRAAGQE